jgi:hypothetical protein
MSSLRDDPRFNRVMDQSRERFRASRARIIARLVSEGFMSAADAGAQ